MQNVTISQQINNGKRLQVTDKGMRLQSLIMTDPETVLLLNTWSIMSKYKNEFMKHVNKYELSDDDISKYTYKPELLSYDVYGTIEMAPFILQLNNMVSASEFSNLEEGLYLFSGDIEDFLNEIQIKETQTIKTNRADINKELSS